MLKRIGGNQEFIQGVTKLSLDELYEEANRLGKVEIGGMQGSSSCRIDMTGVGSDWVNIRSNIKPTLKENMAECIARGRAVKQFYQSML